MWKSLLLFLLFQFSLFSFEAKVIGITDGDTIKVLTSENTQIRIRLDGIDCPESKQDFGSKAKQFASDFCFGKTVRIEKTGEDRYGRTLGFVYVGDSCLNFELLKAGLAWHYKQYNKDSKLAMMEDTARRKKIGVWSRADAEAPWEFRKRK